MKNNLAFGGNNASLIMSMGVHTDYAKTAPLLTERIVLTGVGLVSPAGLGIDGVAHLSSTPAPLVNEGLVPPIDFRAIDRRLDVRGIDRGSQFAVAAAQLALNDAGIGSRGTDRSEIGFIYACDHSPAWAEAEHITSLQKASFHINQVTAFPCIVPNSVTGHVCRILDLRGFNNTLCLGTGAGLLGLEPAIGALQCSSMDALLYGASDALSQPQRDYIRCCPEAHTPPGEAAVMLVLERESVARARGAAIQGYICAAKSGFCLEDAEVNRLVIAALAQAGIGAPQIGLTCFRREVPGEATVITDLGLDAIPSIDFSGQLGNPQSSLALIHMVGAIKRLALESVAGKNYILLLFRSAYGFCGVAVLSSATPY